MHQSFAGAAEIDAHGRQTGGDMHVARRDRPGQLAVLQGGVDHVVDRMRLELQFDFAGIEPRHFAGFAHQAVQAVAFLVDDGEQFVRCAIGERRDSKADW